MLPPVILLVGHQYVVNENLTRNRAGPVLSIAQGESHENPDLTAAAEEHLKFLYASYFTVKGCTEASIEFAKKEFLPTVSLDEARETMREVEEAAKEMGLDVEGAWITASPIGETTAAALKKDTDGNLQRCKLAGRYFRLILARFQAAITGLGSKRSVIRKDF
jgi:hypothetical protein